MTISINHNSIIAKEEELPKFEKPMANEFKGTLLIATYTMKT